MQGYLVTPGMCLCVCRQLDDSHRVTVFSRDMDGRTALHIAARIGIHTCIYTIESMMLCVCVCKSVNHVLSLQVVRS